MKNNNNNYFNQDFLDDIKGIINNARLNAVRSVDFCRVQMYWNIGKRIFEEEQEGKDRAEYGSYLLKRLALELEPEYGSGFSVRQLEQSRQFYRIYPIANAVRSQLNWTQYRRLIQIHGVYDTSVILLSIPRRQHEQSVSELKHCFLFYHFLPPNI